MPTLLSTDPIKPGERLDWWHARTAELFGTPYRIEPDAGAPFHMGLSLEFAEPLALFAADGCAHHARRMSDDDDGGRVVVHFQIDGHCTINTEGRETLLKPGDLTLHRVSRSQDLHFHEPYRQVCAVLPGSSLALDPGDWSRLAGAAIPTATGTAAVLADHLQSLARHADALQQPGAAALTQITVGLICATLQGLDRDRPGPCQGLKAYHLERVKRYALARLHDPGLDMDRVADGVGLSTRYIHRLFEDESLSFMRWVMKERLQRAHAQLRQTVPRRSIAETAYAWGFSDHAHFTRGFRRQFGMSPSDVRGLDQVSGKG